MSPGPLQIALVILLIILLFGRGKISEMMGDVAKGIRSFKKGLQDDPEAGKSAKVIDQTPDNQSEKPVDMSSSKAKSEEVVDAEPAKKT